MKREMEIARCGLACCLCSQNEDCHGCGLQGCTGSAWCENLKCSKGKNLKGCYECETPCEKGLLKKVKPNAFTMFARLYGVQELLDCLERNEKNGIIYHRSGIDGDYDDFEDINKLVEFIKTGKR